MLPKSDDKTLEDRSRKLADAKIFSQGVNRHSLPAKLGISAFVAVSVIAGPCGRADAASDNPPASLLAKIQLATQATNTTTTLSRARTQRSKRPQVVGKSK